MIRLWLTNAAVVFACTTVAAAEDCVSIENDLDRLACYDRKSGRTAMETVVATPDEVWTTRTERSEFEDTTNVYITTQSKDDLQCQSFGSAQKAVLFLRCLENTTSIFISTNCHLASGFQGYGVVDYRIDDRPASSREFDASTNNKALGLWRGSSAIPFIKQLFDGERLLVRFTPFSKSPVTAEFEIGGVEEVVKPLREACNW